MSEAVSAAAPATSAGAAGASQAQASTQAAGGDSQTGGGAQTQAQGAPNPGETKAETQERILAEQDLDAFIEYPVNGKKEKVKIREALKHFGLEQSATKKAMEAARIQKQQAQLIHFFQNDPDKFFEATGTDRDQWLRKSLGGRKEIAEEILAAEYERQELQKTNPEALRARDLEEKLKGYEQRETQAKEPLIAEIKKILPPSMMPKGLENATVEQLGQFLQVKQQEFKAGVDNISTELLGAWEKSGLPKVKEMGQWMAQVMLDHQKRTGQPLQPELAAAKVKTRYLDTTRQMLSQMDAKAIQETLGEEILQKLRDYDVQRVSQQGPQFGVKENGPALPAANEPKKTMNQFEFRKWAGIG